MPASSSDPFVGHYRKDVKTSIYRLGDGTIAPAEPSDLGQLLTQLPPDPVMRERYPDITVSPTASDAVKEAAVTTRVAEEQHNVVVHAFLWATRLEGDNDFHVVIGTTADPSTAQYMNVEVSGLPDPTSPDYDQLRQVRADFLALMGTPPGNQRYEMPKNPMPVRVVGSLLFDGDHTAGKIGPPGHNPQTVWELHPVITIEAMAVAGDPTSVPEVKTTAPPAPVNRPAGPPRKKAAPRRSAAPKKAAKKVVKKAAKARRPVKKA